MSWIVSPRPSTVACQAAVQNVISTGRPFSPICGAGTVGSIFDGTWTAQASENWAGRGRVVLRFVGPFQAEGDLLAVGDGTHADLGGRGLQLSRFDQVLREQFGDEFGGGIPGGVRWVGGDGGCGD